MIIYLFSDIFKNNKRFFRVDSMQESKFLYLIAFGFMPRRFENTEEDQIIYDEEEEVPEMYFITSGEFGIGFSLNSNGVTSEQYYISRKEKGPQLMCDHYVVNQMKCEFIYMAQSDVTAFALSKKFLFSEVFPVFPEIAAKIKEESRKFYHKHVYKPIHEDRMNKISKVNKKSVYKNIEITQKDVHTCQEHGCAPTKESTEVTKRQINDQLD